MDACDTGLQLDHDRANPVECLSQVGSGHSGVWVETAAQKQDLVITLLRSLESPQAFISSLLEALLVRVAACKPTWSLQFLQNSVGTCYSCFLVREKRQGKDKYETAMRKNQRRTEVKAGEEKQHGKYLLCMSTREVISANQNFGAGWGELEVCSNGHPDTFSTRQEGQDEVTELWECTPTSLPVSYHGSKAAAVLDDRFLKCLQFVPSTAAISVCVHWWHMGS